ncbi:polysaccharide biosynthesis protein [Evansella cellulosilytica]|uniref:Polysaccharide biosynthesis protein n=1 Tax=Evansella cellulosilytica (strain ATCC 21833 / DSM 2522 / FERM P-1141 / JCM 9156 / N-4) TaxID=649639 RepID=E6TRQ4_EVAC2|nr:polysaccharide biosynthesis protein [Evansella cellulosilytica]ADU28348.1 polysaccharide biosynthesis protein [Evansella cellulosilytica DSM 2522]
MKENKAKVSLLKGALYLSLAAFVGKVLSALYKVPYQNMTGDVGYYVYQQVYPLYGIAFVLATYGFPIVLSKTLAEMDISITNVEEKYNRIVVLFIAMFIFNGMIGAALMIFANSIAILMGDPQLTIAIRYLGLPFFVIAFLSLARGYFQSQGNMVPSSISQVVEQTVRIVVILSVATIAMAYNDPYKAGISAGVGAFVGGISGVLVMFVYVLREKKLKKLPRVSKNGIKKVWRVDIRQFFYSSLLVSISAMALIIYQFIDSFTIIRLLHFGGWDDVAAMKGIYDRGWPMIQLGAVVTTVFSYALIPSLTAAYVKKEYEHLRQLTMQSIKVCIVFGGAAAFGLIVVLPHLNPMLFKDQSGVIALQILSTTVLFAALFMTIAALLHAINRARDAALLLAAGVVIKIIGNNIAVPVLGIEGAALSSAISFLIIACCALYLLKRHRMVHRLEMTFMIKFVCAIIVMIFAVKLFEKGLLTFYFHEGIVARWEHTLLAITLSLIGAIIFIVFIWIFKVFNRAEWYSLPKISKILPYK